MCKSKNKQIVTEYEYVMNYKFKLLTDTIKIVIKLSITSLLKFKNIYTRVSTD